MIPTMSNATVSSKPPVTSLNEPRKERRILTIIMLLGLVNGLIFVFIMPPWQH